VKRPPEVGAKVSAALLGKYRGELNPRFGIPRSEEVRNKVSAGHGGRQFCDESGNVYKTRSDASKLLSVDRNNVTKVLNGQLKTTGGHTFRYLEDSQS
jgi:hypothetical protein